MLVPYQIPRSSYATVAHTIYSIFNKSWSILQAIVMLFVASAHGPVCDLESYSLRICHYGLYRSLTKEGPTMDCLLTPQFCLNFLLWSKAYLNERPPGESTTVGFSHCPASLRMWWDTFIHTTMCKLHCCTMVYTSRRCLDHNVMCYLHCLSD